MYCNSSQEPTIQRRGSKTVTGINHTQLYKQRQIHAFLLRQPPFIPGYVFRCVFAPACIINNFRLPSQDEVVDFEVCDSFWVQVLSKPKQVLYRSSSAAKQNRKCFLNHMNSNETAVNQETPIIFDVFKAALRGLSHQTRSCFS